VDPAPDDHAARLAAIYPRLDHPPGVMLGVLRLPVLDPILDELESLAASEPLPEDVRSELTRLAELLSNEMLGTASETVPRRGRIVELLRLADGGRLPSLAADDQDPFGAELRAMLESDADLRTSLGRVYSLILRATSVSPTGRWARDARELAESNDAPQLGEATRRTLAALVRAPIESRPDLLLGGLRPVNQRLARGLLWFAAVALPEPAETLGFVGLRMGTSGRNDAVVRDVALANTCAALLGESTDPGAAAALVSMHRLITNRNVLKQVGRALEAIAGRRGVAVDDVIDESLPALGLDWRGRREIDAGPVRAQLDVQEDGHVRVRWRAEDGTLTDAPPKDVATREPTAVAEMAATTAAVEAALAEERGALELRLGSLRSWPAPVVRRRFLEHPLSGAFARRLVWAVDGPGSPRTVLPSGDGWVGPADVAVPDVIAGARLRPWHPAESSDAEIAAWRATLAVRGVRQPFAQVDREVFRASPEPAPAQADVRFAGRIVDHGRLRALLREKRWAVPALGAWDQGDEATGWRAFDDGLRAELRYQAPERVPTGERIQRARLVAVRFVRTGAPPASPATDAVSLPVGEVPRRLFSEALRDVSLAVVVGELPAG
jgi:hypothetical protein